MERRLNPLFQQNLTQKTQIQEKFDPTPQTYMQNAQSTTPSAVATNVMEHLNESKLKMNRIAQKMANFEDRIDGITQEMRVAHSKLSSRFNERGLAEHKIEALIERQNAMINNFEKRMTQMAKVVEESQLQLVRTQSALEDARREIAKLKRL